MPSFTPEALNVFIIVVIVFWAISAFLVADILGDIQPYDRKLTEPRWVRVLMIALSPLTVTGAAVIMIVWLICALIGAGVESVMKAAS